MGIVRIGVAVTSVALAFQPSSHDERKRLLLALAYAAFLAVASAMYRDARLLEYESFLHHLEPIHRKCPAPKTLVPHGLKHPTYHRKRLVLLLDE